MRYLSMLTLLLIVASGDARAGFIARAEVSGGGPPSVQFVRETRSSETLAGRIKRAWKDLVGYKFDVSCGLSHTTCSETGTNRGDARAKCISRNPLCWVADADH
jgi:hypothetical protein